MRPTIRPLGFLKQYINGKSSIEVKAGKSIIEILQEYSIPSELVAGVFLKEKLISKEYILKEEDDVVLMAIIGGG